MTAAQLFWTRRLRRLPAATDKRLCEIFGRLRDGRAVRLLNCDGVFDSPANFGLFHTNVFFPEKSVAVFSDRELKMMLAHEIAHADRHDCLRALPLNVVTAFLWFNPFAAWLRRRIALLREVACDRAVLRRIPADGAADYARLLYSYGLKMRERHFAPGPGLNADFGQTKLRIKEIMMKRHSGFILSGAALLLTSTAVLMIPGFGTATETETAAVTTNDKASDRDKKAVADFLALRLSNPAEAKKQWNSVRDAVMEAGLFDIAGEYYGDPLKIFNDFEKSTRSYMDRGVPILHYRKMMRTGANLIALAEHRGKTADAAAMRRSLDNFKQEFSCTENVTLPAKYPETEEAARNYYSTVDVLTNLGRYQEAAPGALWLWNNIQAIFPSYSAVRVSYLASTIADIAEHDPAMRKWAEDTVADNKRRLLENDFSDMTVQYGRSDGTSPQFNIMQDISSLNHAVFKADEATLEFYRELQSKNPAAAENVWFAVSDQVMDAKMFDVAAVEVPDPLEMFTMFCDARIQTADFYGKNPEIMAWDRKSMAQQLVRFSELAAYMNKSDQIPEMRKKFDELNAAYDRVLEENNK